LLNKSVHLILAVISQWAKRIKVVSVYNIGEFFERMLRSKMAAVFFFLWLENECPANCINEIIECSIPVYTFIKFNRNIA
jgi:hypothetical protein